MRKDYLAEVRNVALMKNVIGSELARTVKSEANAAAVRVLLEAVAAGEARIRLGGGKKAIDAQHAKGRLTARERVTLLVDEGAEFLELGLWAADGMYEEFGGAPGAGTVAGIGRVEGRLCMIVANDATVKAGAFFPMTCKKVLRAQHIALENRIPTLYLVDSAGAFLPLQEEVFPDQDDFGRVFRNNAVMSSLGVPQMTAIMGMCVAGGAYLPVMTDTVLMTEGSGLFLAGPALVQAAIGQKTPAEELGGASMHAEISGTVDFKEPDDESCLLRLRSLVGRMGERKTSSFSVTDYDPVADAPLYAAEDLYGLMDPAPGASNVYDMREVIARLVDRSEFDEYKADFGKTLICGYGRIGGRAVGIVANQKLNQRQTVSQGPMAGTQRIEVGGVIYTDAAQKAARFIMDCNQNLVPLIFLHDVNGFMVGKDAEWSGIIRAGAKMVSAVSDERGAEDYGDCGGELWCGALCDVRQGLRPAVHVCVADGSVCRDGRGGGGEYAGGGKGAADGTVGRDGDGGAEERDLGRDQARLRCGGGPSLWGGSALGGCDYRPGEDARGADDGA